MDKNDVQSMFKNMLYENRIQFKKLQSWQKGIGRYSLLKNYTKILMTKATNLDFKTCC